jgi:SAM-dependent methyltransferase
MGATSISTSIGTTAATTRATTAHQTTGLTGDMTTVDSASVEACTQRIFGAYVDSALVLMIDLADRTGMLDGLVTAPGTSHEVAARTGLDERYVRECLSALVTGGLVGFDPATGHYHLAPEQALCLTGDRATNLAPLSRLTTLLAHHVAEGAEVARAGGGIPYERFRPDFTAVMDGISRRIFDGPLLESIVPLDDALPDRLERGIRVADIGCGTGHSTVVLAEAFPASSFVGYDLSEDALEVGRAEARAAQLSNVTFEHLDVRELPDDPPFDLVVGFDVIHDQVDPSGVLDRVFRALTPGGLFLMLDIRAASRLEDNVGNPLAPFLYGISTLHCMTVSLAHDGAGLGTVWGEELARSMLADAGFVDVTVHEVPDDPLNQVYLARTPTR